MNKFLLIILCLFSSLLVNAQQDKIKYLSGAVPEVDGKVIFRKTITVKSQVDDQVLFEYMNKWAQENYNTTTGDLKNRVLLSDVDNSAIACSGEKYLVFKRSALVLDQAKMIYQLIIDVKNGKCDVAVRNIKYDYSDSKKLIPAEEMISDNIALNKQGDKLNRQYDKFRIYTVDSVNSIFKSIEIYLNGTSTAGVGDYSKKNPVKEDLSVALPIQQNEEPIISLASQAIQSLDTAPFMQGYRAIAPDKIPGNYVKLLNDWTLITSGTSDQANVMTATWGGLGFFWDKPVAFCFLNPTRYSVQTMDKGETYTISFYTEAYKDALKYTGSVTGKTTDKIKGSGLTPIKTPSGATAFAEAWMILECRKIVAQQLSPDAIVDKTLPTEWSKNGYHKMYIGEILNVWVK